MSDKINLIDEEIKKLLDKKKKLISKRESDIGKYLLSNWNIDFDVDSKVVKEIIDNPDIKKIVESKLSNKVPIENSNPQNSNLNNNVPTGNIVG